MAARDWFSTLALGVVVGLTLAACGGGGDDDGVTPIDAPPEIDAAVDAAIDAPACSLTMCGTECVDTSSDEQFCGNCQTACDPGEACLSSSCQCPPAFLPANATFVQEMIDTTTVPGVTLGLGGMFNATIDALVVGYATDTTVVGMDYTLTDTVGTPPFVGAGYDLDLQTLNPTASFYATAGTLRFTELCTGGFSGVLTDATFAAVEGLTNPVLVPGGCTFQVASVTFHYGTTCQ